MDHQAAKAKAKALGLVVIGKYDDMLPNKTCRILVRKGIVILERHVALSESQEMVRDAKREVAASQITGVGLTMDSPKQFPLLTKLQQATIDATLVGFEYDKS